MCDQLPRHPQLRLTRFPQRMLLSNIDLKANIGFDGCRWINESMPAHFLSVAQRNAPAHQRPRSRSLSHQISNIPHHLH